MGNTHQRVQRSPKVRRENNNHVSQESSDATTPTRTVSFAQKPRNKSWRGFQSLRLSAQNLRSFLSLRSLGITGAGGESQGSKRSHSNYTPYLDRNSYRRSYRYSSRRVIQASSSRDPYRHGKTNYPVSLHEALFLPEFSVNGEVTERDFEIVDMIASGAFGSVLKVKRGGGHFAMKVLSKNQIVRESAIQQVKDEVTIQSMIGHHPFIVPLLHFWQSKRFLYMVSTLVPGGELLALWQQMGAMPERVVRVYAAQLAMVIDFLHNAGIIYRDIKMENILLDADLNVQLIDFGLSKWLRMGERTNTICGTIQYMAPEILSLDPYMHCVDWWSLGILLYSLVSGGYPIMQRENRDDMINYIINARIALDDERISYDMRSLINKLLTKSPYYRLQSLDLVQVEPVFRGLNFQTVYTRQVTPRQQMAFAQKLNQDGTVMTMSLNKLVVASNGSLPSQDVSFDWVDEVIS